MSILDIFRAKKKAPGAATPEAVTSRKEIMNTTIVQQTEQGDLFTTSAIMAEGMGVEHRQVIRAVRTFLDDLHSFGRVDFENQPFETSGGTQNREVARLSEPQATFILTTFRNIGPVKEFKKNLVHAFYEMAEKLANPAPTELSRLDILHMAIESEQQRIQAVKRAEALESYAETLEPKAEAYDHFMDADGTYSVGSVAKMLGRSQNKLFDQLRNVGILIAKGPMRNTPYQHYMHHFAVKAFEYERSSGERGTSYTTRVQPSGVDFIRRKLGIPTIKEAA